MATTATPTALSWLSQALIDLPAGERVYATGIPWAVYTRLADLRDERRSGVKITFDRGRIELMSPSFRHEKPHARLSQVVIALAEHFDGEVSGAGATTFRRESGEQGLEPDDCFYIAHAEDVIGLDDIDLTIHPPPDLAIEVDATHSSVGKEAIYGPMGVPELWRHDEGEVTIRHLQTDQTYQTASHSLSYPQVTAADLTRLLIEGLNEGDVAFARRCRTWAKTLAPSAS